MCLTITEIANQIKKIESETNKIKKLKLNYQVGVEKKKRDVVKDYLIYSGGLPFIRQIFGSIENFLICLGREDYYAGFSRQYIGKLEKYLKELEMNQVLLERVKNE